ncbi:MAG TPA: response regulator [Polyangiaceae bacterium]|jgi:DNA-binding response OmpR family regulator
MNEAVVIVDDSLTVRMDLADAFRAAGFRPIPCATGEEARGALAREKASLVVLDVLLPDADGVELLREIRSTGSSTLPVLMLSTEADVKDRIRALQIGADDYVGKPYDINYVVARARELVGQGAQGELTKTSVLVIDDSATFRAELRRTLEGAGYSVLDAATGEDGLHVAAANRPAAILVDGLLPGVDGAAVIRRIRLDEALRQTPCVLLTGDDDHGAELRALDAGADAFMRKDEHLDVVLARLAAILRAVTAAPMDAASLFGPKRILAVDDSPTYLHELGEILRSEGYDVVLARSGEEAIELLSIQTVDCILLDLVMPGLGGKATCQRIKDSPVVRDVPLIMLTSLDDRESMIEGLKLGADDYISKSSEFEVLKVRVRAQMRRKQFEDEHRRVRETLLHSELLATQERAAREIADARAALVGELQRKNEELEAFSYAVSHDLRAPLRGIDGFSVALLEEYGELLEERGRGYLDHVRSGTHRMAELIDGLLELSRVGRADIQRGRVNISEIARKVFEELKGRDPNRSVDLVVEDDLKVDADRRLMRVLFDNLVGNAWKFTSKAAAPCIQVGAEQREGATVYFVRDNGAGFDMAYAEKLFTPFQRLHNAADFPGTGVGLATVHRVVDRHGGRIWAEGAVGRGAAFFFTLPPSAAS